MTKVTVEDMQDMWKQLRQLRKEHETLKVENANLRESLKQHIQQKEAHQEPYFFPKGLKI